MTTSPNMVSSAAWYVGTTVVVRLRNASMVLKEALVLST